MTHTRARTFFSCSRCEICRHKKENFERFVYLRQNVDLIEVRGSQSAETGEVFKTLQNDALTNEYLLFAPPPQLETRHTRAPKARAEKIWILAPEILRKWRKFDSPRPNLGKVDPPSGNSREVHYFSISKNLRSSLFFDFQKLPNFIIFRFSKIAKLHYFQILKNRSSSL